MFPQFSVSWLMFGDNPDNEVTIDYNKVIYTDDGPVGLELGFKKKETGLDFVPEFIFPPTGIIKIQLSFIKEKFEITLRYVSNDL